MLWVIGFGLTLQAVEGDALPPLQSGESIPITTVELHQVPATLHSTIPAALCTPGMHCCSTGQFHSWLQEKCMGLAWNC